MSTVRYVNNARIRLTYVDRLPNDPMRGGYRCFFRMLDGSGYGAAVYVGHPTVLTEAVDSPEAFDDAARAAVAFSREDFGVEYDHETVTIGECEVDRIRVSRRRAA